MKKLSEQFIKLHIQAFTGSHEIYLKVDTIDSIEANEKDGSFVITRSTSATVTETPAEILQLMDKASSND